MEGIGTLLIGIQTLFGDPFIFVLILIGVFIGIVFGSIPGLTGALGISLMLPFTYVMSAQQGLSILIALYVGSISGGLISAILLNIPGTPASVVTCFDGAPMARGGRPGTALMLGTYASLVGGLISAVALVLIAPPLAKVALQFGSWEYFAMGVMGLCIVVSLCSTGLIKGFIAAGFGVLMGMVGIDPVSATNRFTFGMWQLGAGFDTLAVLMGLFALTEILGQFRTMNREYKALEVGKLPWWPTREMLKGTNRGLISGSLIGTFIGILPGVGQTTASLLSYSQAKQTSKTPEKFGTGCADGIIASESANNAVCGGALIPMMTLGIPGDVVTAILMGGLVIHGLQPGPTLFASSKSVVGIVFVVFIIANVMMYLMQLGLMRAFVKLLEVPLNYLFPAILLMCMLGAMTANNRVFDAGVLIVMGLVGYFMVKNQFPIPPMVLGFVMSGIIELNFRIAIIASDGSIMPLFGRPMAMVLLVFGVFMAAMQPVRNAINRKKGKETLLDA